METNWKEILFLFIFLLNRKLYLRQKKIENRSRSRVVLFCFCFWTLFSRRRSWKTYVEIQLALQLPWQDLMSWQILQRRNNNSNLEEVVYFGVDQGYDYERHHILECDAEQSVTEVITQSQTLTHCQPQLSSPQSLLLPDCLLLPSTPILDTDFGVIQQ